MNTRFVFPLWVFLAGLVLGFQPAWGETGGKGSFSPIAEVGDNGKPFRLSWTYAVNRGRPIFISQVISGVRIDLQLALGDLRIAIDPSSLRRTASFSASISGSAQGSAAFQISETIRRAANGSVSVSDQNLKLNIEVSAQGVGANVVGRAVSQIVPPVEWFPARDDLDLLDTGFAFEQTPQVALHVQGSVCLSVQGRRECNSIDQQTLAPHRWEVVGRSDALKVRGKTYSNVVHVVHDTVDASPDDLSGGVALQPARISYWFAKGFGLIKATGGAYRFLGRPLSLEIKSSSLKLPRIVTLRRATVGGSSILKISGMEFGKQPGQVFIGGDIAPVLSWKTSQVRANLPAGLPPGTYQVKLIRANEVESVAKSFRIQ